MRNVYINTTFRLELTTCYYNGSFPLCTQVHRKRKKVIYLRVHSFTLTMVLSKNRKYYYVKATARRMTFEHDKVEYDIWGKSRMRNLNFYLSTRQLPD